MSASNILEKATHTFTATLGGIPADVRFDYSRVDNNVSLSFRATGAEFFTATGGAPSPRYGPLPADNEMGLVGTLLLRDRTKIGQPLLLPVIMTDDTVDATHQVAGLCEMEGNGLAFKANVVGGVAAGGVDDRVYNGTVTYVLP